MGIPLTLSEVPDLTPYVQYVATNGQTVYPYPFPITQDSDLVVVINGVTQATDSTYSLSGQGNDTGGNVTLNTGSNAGDIITLYRDIAIERITQISQNSGFSSTAFNAEFNNIYLILQQLEDSIGFCLQVPNTNNPSPTTELTPAAYAGYYLAFNSAGNPTPAALTSSGSITQAIIANLLFPGSSTITAADLGGVLWPQTTPESDASVTPTNLYYLPGDLRRYGATAGGNVTTALANACAQAQETDGAPVYIPAALGTACTITAGVTISSPVTIYGDGPSNSVLNTSSDITVFTFTSTSVPGSVLRDFQLVGMGNVQAQITGYIVGTALTVSSVVSGAVATGQTIRGRGTTNGATTGATAFGLEVNSGSGTSWVVSASGNVYSSGSPGTFFLGPANPAIVLTSSPYNQFHRLKISGFGYGVELQTGGNASFLNSFNNCQIISNSMANLYLQSQSHQTTLNACTIGGGNVGWGAYVTDSAGFSVYGGDCEGTAQVGIELDNVASTANGAHFISGMDFEGNRDVGGNIRIGNTEIVYGVMIANCTFDAGGAGDNYAINPVTCTGAIAIGCNFASGYGYEDVNTANGANLTLIGCRNASTSGAASGSNLVQYNGGILVGSGTNGLGYQAGNGVGGVVTQLTSRTTGVTLNTLAGAITMYTAAGSATPAEFTVTNSCVAANDVVLVTVKSGATNTYTFQVTATVGGSFNITFWTTGGTSSDTPILNFVVIKGAAS
jgi:hypothetical protein